MPPYHITFEGHCVPTSGYSIPAPGATVTRNEVLPFLAPTACAVLFLGLVLPASEPDRASHVKFGARRVDAPRGQRHIALNPENSFLNETHVLRFHFEKKAKIPLGSNYLLGLALPEIRCLYDIISCYD